MTVDAIATFFGAGILAGVVVRNVGVIFDLFRPSDD
nr:MAG TPA: hypothetical protein [Inoviridae sp.]